MVKPMANPTGAKQQSSGHSPLSFYRGKKVLITGNTGFKGAWLSAWLESLGAEVHGLSNDIPTLQSAFSDLGGDDRFPTAFVDIRDFEATAAELGRLQPDVVFHLAAQSLVRPSYSAPIATWGTNVMGTLHILEAVRRTESVTGCAVISSDKCYENLEKPGYAYAESDRLGGKDPYSASKAGTELVFKSHFESYFRKSETCLLSFRAGNVLGGGDYAVDRIVPDCIRSMQEKKPAVIRSPGATRPWQHVLEPLGGYLLAMARAMSEPANSRWSGESFNFGPAPENSKSVEALVTEMKKNLPGFEFSIDPAASRSLHEATNLQVSYAKAKEWMGWQPTLGFEETIRWTTEGYTPEFKNHVARKIEEFSGRFLERLA